MIQAYIYLFLPLTSVLAYYPPRAINQHTDRFELPPEFWSHHFGSDFKNAIHFHLQRSDLTNSGNMLYKHVPEERSNGNFKRSAEYVLHTPQPARQQNYLPQNFMKVQLLPPGEIEALERGMKSNEMYRSPIVVTLPEFGEMQRKSFNPPTPPSPMLRNNELFVYQGNQKSTQPQFPQNDQGIWPQNQHYAAYEPTTGYDQLPKPSLEKTVKPSFEKTLVSPFQTSHHQSSVNNPTQRISLSPPETKMNPLMLQPFFDASDEPSPEQPSIEKPSHKQPSYIESLYKQPMRVPRKDEELNRLSRDLLLPPSMDKIVSPIDKKNHSAIDKTQLSFDGPDEPLAEWPSIKKSSHNQPSYRQSLYKQPMSSMVHKEEESTKLSGDFLFPSSIDKMSSPIDRKHHKTQPTTEKVQPSVDKKHQSVIEKMLQPSVEQKQTPNELISPSSIAVQPSYRQVHATFEITPTTYPKMRHHSYEDVKSSYHPQPPVNEFDKQNRYEEMYSYHPPAVQDSRTKSYEKSSSSDGSRQSSHVEKLERNFGSNQSPPSVDVRNVRHEYRVEKKTR